MSKPVVGILLIFLSLRVFSQGVNDMYEIYAIPFANVKNYIQAKEISINPVVQDSVKIVFMTWLLKGQNGKTVLVDAGFQRSGKYFADWLANYVRPDSSLLSLDIKPVDVTDIIISHPHWDHIGGIDLFPNATIWIQKKDYGYFLADAWQKEENSRGFDSSDVLKLAVLNTKGRVQLINGDGAEIIPGITVYTGSKHTYESQFAVINTSTDKVLIASDNCWFYYNLDHMISIPLTFDPGAYVKSLQRMKTLVSPGLIIPGHDAKIFERFTKVKNGIVKIR